MQLRTFESVSRFLHHVGFVGGSLRAAPTIGPVEEACIALRIGLIAYYVPQGRAGLQAIHSGGGQLYLERR